MRRVDPFVSLGANKGATEVFRALDRAGEMPTEVTVVDRQIGRAERTGDLYRSRGVVAHTITDRAERVQVPRELVRVVAVDEPAAARAVHRRSLGTPVVVQGVLRGSERRSPAVGMSLVTTESGPTSRADNQLLLGTLARVTPVQSSRAITAIDALNERRTQVARVVTSERTAGLLADRTRMEDAASALFAFEDRFPLVIAPRQATSDKQLMDQAIEVGSRLPQAAVALVDASGGDIFIVFAHTRLNGGFIRLHLSLPRPRPAPVPVALVSPPVRSTAASTPAWTD